MKCTHACMVGKAPVLNPVSFIKPSQCTFNLRKHLNIVSWPLLNIKVLFYNNTNFMWEMYHSQLSTSSSSSHLITMGRVSPRWRGVTLAVMVKGVKVGGRAILSVKVSRGNRWRHPLVVCEKRHQCFPARFGIVTIGPVSVHEPGKVHLLLTHSEYTGYFASNNLAMRKHNPVKLRKWSDMCEEVQYNTKVKQSLKELMT